MVDVVVEGSSKPAAQGMPPGIPPNFVPGQIHPGMQAPPNFVPGQMPTIPSGMPSSASQRQNIPMT